MTSLIFGFACTFLLLLPVSSMANNIQNGKNSEFKEITWTVYDFCSCSAKVNPAYISEENVSLFYNEFSSFRTPMKIDWPKLYDATDEELRSEFNRYKKESTDKITKLSSLNLPDTPSLQKYRSAVIHGFRVNQFLYLSELDYLLTASTDSLRGSFPGQVPLPQCDKWTDALESNEKTYAILPELREQICKSNANLKRCKERSLAKTSQNDRGTKIEVLIFGWHNCLNGPYRDENTPDFDAALKGMGSYLKDIECNCDD